MAIVCEYCKKKQSGLLEDYSLSQMCSGRVCAKCQDYVWMLSSSQKEKQENARQYFDGLLEIMSENALKVYNKRVRELEETALEHENEQEQDEGGKKTEKTEVYQSQDTLTQDTLSKTISEEKGMIVKDEAASKLQKVNTVIFILALIGVGIMCIYDVVNAKVEVPSRWGSDEKWSAGLAFVRVLIWCAVAFGLWIEKLLVDCFCRLVNHVFEIKTLLADELSARQAAAKELKDGKKGTPQKWICPSCKKENMLYYVDTCSCGQKKDW